MDALQKLLQLSQKFLINKNQSYRRYFIQTTILTERLSILIGQRGVGKTTILVQYLLDYVHGNVLSQKILYVPSDHLSIGELSLYAIAEEFEKNGGELIAFDEIHKITKWSAELKSIFDSFPKLKILASGSSALEIYRGSHDLSRRSITYRIPGLSFREYLEIALQIQLPALKFENILENHQTYCHTIISELKKKCAEKILPNFRKYLTFGYYPYFFELNDISKFEITIEQNVHTTIEADLVSIHPHLSGLSIKRILHLLTFIAQNAPYTPNLLKLRKLLEIGDERTLKIYLSLLEEAELLIPLYKSSEKLDSFENPAKIYLQNTNLCSVIAKGYENIGTMRETFLLNMFYRTHSITLPLNGDFLIDKTILLEAGGANKSTKQIRNHQKSFVIQDNIEVGIVNKIPLWVFGFLY